MKKFSLLLLPFVCISLFSQEIHTTKRGAYTYIHQGNSTGLVANDTDTIIPLGKYSFLNPMDSKGFFLAEKDKKWGFIDANDKILIPFIYDDLSVFSEEMNIDLAPANKKAKWGFIDREGQVVIDFQYEHAPHFYKIGLAHIHKGKKHGLINIANEEVVPIIYEDVKINPHDTIAYVKKGNQWALFSKEGRQLTPFEFDNIVSKTSISRSNFSGKMDNHPGRAVFNGTLIVEKNGKRALYNLLKGFIVSFGTYDTIEPFEATNMTIVSKEGMYGVINSDGEVMIPLAYGKISHPDTYCAANHPYFIIKDVFQDKECIILNEDLEPITDHPLDILSIDSYPVLKDSNGKYAYIKDLKISIPFEYDYFKQSFAGTAIVKKDGKFGIIDLKDNSFLFEADCDTIHDEKDFLLVEKDSLVKILDRDLKISNDEYQWVRTTWYNNKQCAGKYIVRQNDKYGVLDRNFATVIPIIYDGISGWVEYGPEGHYMLKNGKIGMMECDGSVTIPPIYDFVWWFYNSDIISVVDNDKHGIINRQNKVILPIEFDHIFAKIDYWNFEPEDKKEDKLIAKKDGVWQYYSLEGKLIKENLSESEIRKEMLMGEDQPLIYEEAENEKYKYLYYDFF